MKILIVDDSSVMRRIVTNALATGGITDVVEAGDGEQAIVACSQHKFDAILMDWNMPRMTGIEALKVIRGAGETVPVIMVTTEAEKSRVMEALKSGANNYVVKPFEPAVLVEKIKATIPAAA